MNQINKKAQYKYEIVIALILGLVVVSLAGYFIFQEYFNKDMLDRETCRQSVILRSAIPDIDYWWQWFNLKKQFPLKCRTTSVVIDYKDVKKATTAILEEAASCWYLYGQGSLQFMPSTKYEAATFCVPCSRISFSADVQGFYDENKINIKNAIINKDEYNINGKSYYGYLNSGDGAFEYKITEGEINATATVRFGWSDGIEFEADEKDNTVDGKEYEGLIKMPSIVNPADSLLLIVHQGTEDETGADTKTSSDSDTNLFFIHVSDISETENVVADVEWLSNLVSWTPFVDDKGSEVSLCMEWDGVPA
jgi:hypothetical protein